MATREKVSPVMKSQVLMDNTGRNRSGGQTGVVVVVVAGSRDVIR
jgi:hypothetical protein